MKEVQEEFPQISLIADILLMIVMIILFVLLMILNWINNFDWL